MKSFSRTHLFVAAVAFAALSSTAPARADSAGDAVLAQMDAAVNRAQTLQFEYEIVHQEPGRAARTLGMTMLVKGEWRLAEFTYGGDLKGVRLLIRSPTRMFVHLPARGTTEKDSFRFTPSHNSDERVAGLCFSPDDLAITEYGPHYKAALTAETPLKWVLTLTPKPGQEAVYAKIQITVAKDKKVPLELKYFGAAGKNIKTELRTGYSCEGDVCTPSELKMTDNVYGSITKFIAKSRQVNAEISDDTFSRNSLDE